MSDRVFYWFIGIVIAALLVAIGIVLWLIFQQQKAPTPRAAGCQTFQATGKTVCGRFLTYWLEHGGVGQQVYPLTGEFREVSLINGQPYTVHYFERSVFEYHPENAPPFDVLLSLLGTIRYRDRYAAPPPAVTALPAALHPKGSARFTETGKVVYGVFLDYWLAHGGLMQFGYPLTDPSMELSAVNGQLYLVQYFERGEFELHPENQPPYDVLPALVGRFELARKYPDRDPSVTTPTATSDTPSPNATPRP